MAHHLSLRFIVLASAVALAASLCTASRAADTQPATKPALSSDFCTIRDYCTVVLAPKVQDALHVTDAQRDQFSQEHDRLERSMAANAGRGPSGQAGATMLLGVAQRLTEIEGQRIRDILTVEQDQALQDMFQKKQLRPIGLEVAKSVIPGRGGTSAGEIEITFTHYAGPSTPSAATTNPPDTKPATDTPVKTDTKPPAIVKPTVAAGTASNAPPLKLTRGPLDAAFAKTVADAIDSKSYKAGDTLGGGFARDKFDDIAPDGGILIGLRCGMGKFAGSRDIISSVQPVYLTPKGVVMGKLHGNPAASPVVDLVARDGYIVGGAMLGGGANLDSVTLKFVRFAAGKIDPNDSYNTDRIGNTDQATTVTGTMPAVGITGKSNDTGSIALGLVFLNPPPTSVMPVAKGPMTPLAATFADAVKDAVDKKTYQAGAVNGGRAARTEYEEIAPDGGILIGLRCGMGKAGNNETISSEQAIFLTPKGEVLGKIHGDATATPVKEIKAPPGYAVGSVAVAGGAGMDSLTITFMKIGDKKLVTADPITADKVGGSGGGTPVLYGGDGTPVIGIKGKEDRAYTALGLIFLTPTDTANPTPGRGRGRIGRAAATPGPAPQ